MKLGRRGRWVGKATGERGGDVTAKDNDAWREYYIAIEVKRR